MAKSVWMMRFDGEPKKTVMSHVASLDGLRLSLATLNAQTRHEVISNPDFKDTLLLDTQEISRCKFPQFSASQDSAPDEYDDKYYLYAYQALERDEAKEGSLNFSDRTYLVDVQRKFWSHLIDKSRPDVVMFSDIPHRYFELVLVAILRERGIPIVYFFQPLNRAHTFTDSNFRVVELEENKHGESHTIGNAVAEKVKEVGTMEMWEFDQARQKKGSSSILVQIGKSIGLGILQGWREYFHSFVHAGLRHRTVKPNRLWRVMLREVSFALKILYCKACYRGLTTKRIPAKYIYFPLTSQFENTQHPSISPLSLETAFEHAYSSIPTGHTLLVREHPMQFSFRHNQKFARNLDFYKRMKRYPNVEFAPLSWDQFQLMKGAKYTFCLALSSSLVESLTLQTPVEFVGRLPYWEQTGMSGRVSHLSELRQTGFYQGSLKDSMRQEKEEFLNRIETVLRQVKNG